MDTNTLYNIISNSIRTFNTLSVNSRIIVIAISEIAIAIFSTICQRSLSSFYSSPLKGSQEGVVSRGAIKLLCLVCGNGGINLQ